MYKVLFVCTANIFRSRFSEEVFNFLAKKYNIKALAFSAGLKVGAYISRTIYPPALEYLNIYGIKPQRKNELSTHINKLNLNDYQKIICLDEIEHKPMVLENNRLNKISITYWDIIDEPKVSSSISLPKCYKKVDELIKSIDKINTYNNINKICK
tara:strand:- start:57 stop:521 length:465 start_codon:yes stop_codon:yes gene_type:complete